MAIECAFSLSTFIANVTGVLIGTGVGFLSALHVSNRNAKHSAVAKFRSAFAPIISKIKHTRTSKLFDPEIELPNAFPSMAAAVEEFRPFVRNKDSEAYQKAWEDYYITGFAEYFIGEDCHALFQRRVDAILQFAE